MVKTRAQLILLSLFLTGCQTECYPETGYGNYTHYTYSKSLKKTPVALLDDPNDEVDIQRFQEVTQSVISCVRELQASWNPEPEAECIGKPTFELRACMVVKVAPDWHPNCDATEQVFSCNVPFASCELKGQTYNPVCPCSCRAMIQDNTMIVVTPNLKLYPAYLTTLLTSCYNPWTPSLAKCAAPR